MTIMVPSTVASSAPWSEKSFFTELQNAIGTESWIALHSLHLANHQSKQEGEIDMVLLIPRSGILCLEIKGVGVAREGGTWIYADGRRHPEGPFVQASGAMHSLKNQLFARNSDFKPFLFYSAVVFTGVKFSFGGHATEWHDWQVVDAETLRTRPIEKIFESILANAHKHAALHGKSWYDAAASRPDEKFCKKIVDALRPNFDLIADKRHAIKHIEKKIEAYTQEQFSVLDSLQGNPRVLVSGPAGTGKTIIAIEAFKRAVLSGEKVAFFCFNRLLAKYLTSLLKQFVDDQGAGSRIVISTFHKYMMDIASATVPSEGSTEKFWKADLPSMALEALTDDYSEHEVGPPVFDRIIVDEGQDLLHSQYFDCLDLLLKDGLENSRWLILGDFRNQMIYDGKFSALSDRLNHYSDFVLTKNCRNAGQIAEVIKLLFDVEPAYKSTLEHFDGAEATSLFWVDHDEESRQLKKVLESYIDSVHKRDIVVLSASPRNSAISRLGPEWKEKFTAVDNDSVLDKNKIRFASIHAFKGLEATAVIITDIPELTDEWRTLLYVAISRAKAKVTILMDKKCRAEYQRLLQQGYLS